MSNSIPDVNLTGEWVNIYVATGISVGTALLIQNKSSTPALVYISSTNPVGLSDGYAMVQFETVLIDADEAGVWVKGFGPVHVQVS